MSLSLAASNLPGIGTLEAADESGWNGSAPNGDHAGADALIVALFRPSQPQDKSEALLADLSAEADLDRLIDHLHREAANEDSVRRTASVLRRTVEHSLMQSAAAERGRLPGIIASIMGRAAGLAIESKVRRFTFGLRSWLVLLSSPRRVFWAVQAAWRGMDVGAHVRSRAQWYGVEEIAVFSRLSKACVARASADEAAEGAWLAENPLMGVTVRYQSGTDVRDALMPEPEEEIPSHDIVILGDHCKLVARVSGYPPEDLRTVFQSLCDRADGLLTGATNGKGDGGQALEQLLKGGLKKRGPYLASEFWRPVTLLTVALMIAAGLLVSAGVEHLRWEKLVRLLDAEPGIEVVWHSSAWGQRQIEVFRDPLARSVSDILLAMGCRPGSIRLLERAYMTADEPIASERAQTQLATALNLKEQASEQEEKVRKLSEDASAALEQIKSVMPAVTMAASRQIDEELLGAVRADMLRMFLELPPDLELTLDDKGMLKASGPLLEPAYSRLESAPRALAWLKDVDMKGVRDVTAENITALTESVEKSHLEFLPGSPILSDPSRVRVQTIVRELMLLQDEARLKDRCVRLRMVARHPGASADLARQRIEVARAELLRLQAPADWFEDPVNIPDTPGDAPGPHSLAFRIHLEVPPP